ncbi:MAG: TonB-dependent receptor, partial [Verrucomicrobia bacterium]|nr:TonB-dependent receptor [Verrucomicrobiota bacterium]
MLLEPDLDKVETLFKSSPSLFTLDTAGAALNNVVNDYRAEEDITAAYGMGTLRWGGTTLVTGLRMERNTFSSHTYRFNSATPNAPTRVAREKNYTVWLPGFHLRHELSRNLILRESYNKSYARPDVDKLVAGLNL